MAGIGDAVISCPYCRRALHWVPGRWFGRGCFECEACGEFPDMGGPATAGERRPTALNRGVSRLPPRRDDRPRVLLVDDSAEHRDLYALMLEPTATVVTASGGEEALKIAPADSPDVIVLDVLMPHMDGWEVCRRLKADPATHAIPVIMLTSLDQADLGMLAQDSGATAVLMKPCSVERLASAITESLGSSAPPAVDATPSRRWTRKAVATAVPMRIGELPARLVNISYGGFCLEIEHSPNLLPKSFDITFPMAELNVHAEAIWLRRGPDEHWLCGAQVSSSNDRWRGWVDAIG